MEPPKIICFSQIWTFPNIFYFLQDPWNNPNESQNSNSDHRGQAEQDQVRRVRGRSGRVGGQSVKDAFDNSGNWSDDFPNADEWNNEEYTGSLTNTKVFTASGGQPQSGQKQQAQQPHQPQVQQPHQSRGNVLLLLLTKTILKSVKM